MTGNGIGFSYIGAKGPHWLEVENETSATTGDMGILFDVPTMMKTMLSSAMSFKRDIQYEPTNLQNLVYPAEKTPTHLYILPLKTRADDFMDILLQPPASAGNGRSISIDLKDTVKTKINNIQTVSFSSDGNHYSIFPAVIQGNDVKLYSFHARSNFMSVQVVSFQGTTLDSFSHSIGIDLDSEVKDKIDNMQRIQKESTTATTYIYPVELSGTNATVLPLQALSNDYISVSDAQPFISWFRKIYTD